MKSRSEGAPHPTESKTFFHITNDAVLLQSTGNVNAGNSPRVARGWYTSPPWGFFLSKPFDRGQGVCHEPTRSFFTNYGM